MKKLLLILCLLSTGTWAASGDALSGSSCGQGLIGRVVVIPMPAMMPMQPISVQIYITLLTVVLVPVSPRGQR